MATVFPFGPGFADTITRGDYINLVAIFDLTYPRLKKTLLLGTRWGDENAKLDSGAGRSLYPNYSYNPISVGVAPPPDQRPAPPPGAPPPISGSSPVAPPPTMPQTVPTQAPSQIFTGPFCAEAPSPAPGRPADRHTPRTGRWWPMLTRLVRNQLIIFTIASIVGVAAMLFTYMQVPTLLGVGRINVKLVLPSTGGLYGSRRDLPRRAGRQGHRGQADRERGGSDADPRHVAENSDGPTAEVRSVSAVGEQYVDLHPPPTPDRTFSDGSVIAGQTPRFRDRSARCSITSARSSDAFPRTTSDLLDESFKAFNGAGHDFGSLVDSG